MNKKLLFAALSLAALTACTTDEFESQQKVAENVSPIQFELINSDAETRAYMDGNTVKFSANDGDLFTLYHGATTPGAVTGYQNATYKAEAEDGKSAALTTPSMILPGSAIMVWPADTTFRIKSSDNLTLTIPAEQSKDVENNIPYVSDLVAIADETDWDNPTAAYNNAGYNRTYPIYMRPMASQLNLIADYAGTDATLATLTDIDPIKVTSVELLTTPGGGGSTNFTTRIPVTFTAKTSADNTRWNGKVANNAWSHVTGVNRDGATATSDHLSTKCLTGNESSKFLILPQPTLTTGIADPGIVVNTIYGKVVIGNPTGANHHATQYTADEYATAWYRYLPSDQKLAAVTAEENASAAAASANGLYKTVALNPGLGMQQTINYMGAYVAKSSVPVVETEPIGVALTRYVEVRLNHLDMSDLHIKTDKQLIDAAKVWAKMGLTGVTVYLDGDATTGVFEISQTTIAKINEINTGKALAAQFRVKPCNTAGETCTDIVITGGGAIQNLDFIVKGDASNEANVVLKAGENWKWATKAVDSKKAVTVDATATGVKSIINKGTLVSDATATIAIYDNASTPAQVSAIPFVNVGTWNITNGDLTVQFDVTNFGTVNIKKGAEYHQDIIGANKTTFTNEATTLPKRFLAAGAEMIGLVNNAGVFAVTGNTTVKGVINNYGLIEHGVYPNEAYNADAKTYITANQTLSANGFSADASFSTAFNSATSGAGNKIGRINLPYSNKEEDNISISAALSSGFVSVTVDGEVSGNLNAATVGDKVNYVIINSGVTTITEMSDKIKYIEFNDKNGTEIAWQTGTSASPKSATYEGLIVLSPVNIKLYTNITVNKATYLGAKMYVGGGFTGGSWTGYYGDTSSKVTANYITY